MLGVARQGRGSSAVRAPPANGFHARGICGAELGVAGRGLARLGLYRSAGLVPLVAFREGYKRGEARRGTAGQG